MSQEDAPMLDLEAGETTILLPKGDAEEEPEKEKSFISQDIKEKVVVSASAVATGSSIASLATSMGNPLLLTSGALGACIAPFSAFQEKRIAELEELMEINEQIKEEVANLEAENKRLGTQVDDLETSVKSLKEMEETLKVIENTNSQQVDALEEQLEESKQILERMEGNTTTLVLQNITEVALGSDLDGDGKMSDDEIDFLITKLNSYETVEVNEELFKETIVGKDRSLNGIMAVIKNLLTDDIPDNENIIKITPRKVSHQLILRFSRNPQSLSPEELQELLDADTDTDENEDEGDVGERGVDTDEDKKRFILLDELKDKAISTATTALLGSSLASMATCADNPLIVASSALGAGSAAYSAYQERTLNTRKDLMEINELLDEEIESYELRNQRLESEVNTLEESVKKLKEMKETLEEVENTKTQQVDALKKRLEDSKLVLEKMQGHMLIHILQDIVEVVIGSDLDGDGMMSDDEIHLLITKLNSYGTVQVNEELFRQTIIKKDRSIHGVMNIAKNLLSDNIHKDDKIIDILDV